MLLSTGSLKFRQLDIDGANGEKHVVEYECEPLGRSKCLQNSEQCETDRIRQECLVLGIKPITWTNNWLGHVNGERLFAPGPTSTQHVQTHTRNYGG